MNKRPTILLISVIVLVILIVTMIHFLSGPAKSQNTALLQASNSELQVPSLELIQVKAPNGVIRALVATSSADQEKGLGDRDSLPPDEGMIFAFPASGSYGFWMKDMRFSIDIVWISADKVVAGLNPDISPATYPNLFLPPSPILYVLELNAGQAKRFGITMGTRLKF